MLVHNLVKFQSHYEKCDPKDLLEYDPDVYKKILEIQKNLGNELSLSPMTKRLRGDVSYYKERNTSGTKGYNPRGYGKGGRYARPAPAARTQPNFKMINMNATEIEKERQKRTQELNILLNKITEKTYDKLWQSVTDIIKEDDVYIEYVLNRIFLLASLNKSLKAIYTTAYSSISVSYPEICKEYTTNRIEQFVESFHEIKYVNPQKEYDEYCMQCKKNDQRRGLSSFFCELSRTSVISSELFFSLIYDLYQLLLVCLKNEEKQENVNEIIDNTQILISSVNEVKRMRDDLIVISEIAESNIIDLRPLYPSVTNKCVFKCRDLCEGIFSVET